MDLFWVLVLGGLAYWFHTQLQRVDGLVAQLSLENALLSARLRSLEPGDEPAAPISQPAAEEDALAAEPEPEVEPEPEPEPEPAISAPISKPVSAPKTTARAAGQIEQAWPQTRAVEERAEGQTEPQDPQPQNYATSRINLDFEDIFGRLLPIWGGGIALAIAGFFLVRWSIENGVLNEYVRVALGFVFGLGLTGAAEIAHRFSARLADDRVRQALSGAGIATLYASFYLASTQYGLIGPAVAFIGMAAVTAMAVLLSYRFGLPSAVLGLVGGFATPVLAGGNEPNLPVLATYLALVTGGLAYTGQKQGHSWLSLAALTGGLGWGVLMLISGPVSEAGILAVGGYLVLVGTLLPSLMGHGVMGTIGRIAAAAIAIVQIAALIATSGYSLLAWGCYLLVAAALAVLSWRNHRLREAGAVAAGIAVCLLAAWPLPELAPELGWYITIAAACIALFAAIPLAHIWRENATLIDWGKLCAFPLALLGAVFLQFEVTPIAMQNSIIAVIALGLAMLPAAGAWLTWPQEDEALADRSLFATVSALALVWLSGMLAVPMWAAPLINAGIAGVAFALLHKRITVTTAGVQWAIALIGLVLLLGTAPFSELGQIVYYQPSQPEWLYALRWVSAAVPFALTLLRFESKVARRAAETAVAALSYCALTMVLPANVMPVALATGIVLLAWRLPQRATLMAVWAGMAALWSSATVIGWLDATLPALVGTPVLYASLPTMSEFAQYVLPFLAALGAGYALRAKLMTRFAPVTLGIAGALAITIVHTAYKGVFAISDLSTFAQLGLAERTVWQAALAAIGIALIKAEQKFAMQRMIGMASAGFALAHFTGFTLLLHNPLLTAQAVGAWPLINMLLPAYGVAIGLLVWLRNMEFAKLAMLRPAIDGAVMVLIALLALSQLRHLFAGTILIDPVVGSGEDLLRSMLAIALALAYLGWGAWTRQRSWRIGSLVLMLGAVGKVFVFDAAGLEGLARIVSFMALGLCLIGIGWFYTKQLSGSKRAENKEQEQSA